MLRPAPAPPVVVAVVDTGITALPALADRLLPGWDFVGGDGDADDDNGHGTAVASVVAAGLTSAGPLARAPAAGCCR